METKEKPGVENPKIIDLIRKDPQSGEVVLTMYESRSWPEDEKIAFSRIVQLQNKLDSYASYILDGFMAQQYPDYAKLPVRIELKCVEEPKGIFADFMTAAEDFSSTHQIVFKYFFDCQSEIDEYIKRI